MDKPNSIPAPTIERLAHYSRHIENLASSGASVVSSERLATLCGVNPAQVRKDIGYLGEFGIRGVGYDTRDLLVEIKKTLGTDKEWDLCIVGAGKLGRAILENDNFTKRGYRFTAVFDSAPEKIGKRLPCGLMIEPASRIREIIPERSIDLGIIATPEGAARRTADILMDAGIKAILNFAPIHVRSTDSCSVENVDFTLKLENLAYHLGKKD